MPNRLEPINLIDFTGGLNLRRNQFQLNANESPEMINIAIDPLGGVYTRRGWERWNGADIAPAEGWDPRRAYLSQLADGTDLIHIAANNRIFWAAAVIGSTFSDLGIDVGASPHMADFASFGDDLYIACGHNHGLCVRHGTTVPAVSLTPGGAGSWNDDYLNPVGGVGPKAELIETHSGYLFAANILEDGSIRANRVRWSHPTSPTDWAQADYIEIEPGGSHITGLISYEDHLLIFKRDSIWALYGYNADSWQLVQKSSTVGTVSPQSLTRNEGACFFYSASDHGGIYAYAGERPVEISEQLRFAMEQIISQELVWVGWVGRKLWVTLPWTYDGPTDDNAGVFVFDPSLSDSGAWMYFTAMAGQLGPIVAGSNVDSQAKPLGVLRATDTPSVVRLDALDEGAYDQIWDWAVWGFTAPNNAPPNDQGYIVTGSNPATGAEIILGGTVGAEPFDTVYRTPWITADWPTRKKSFRRPDFVCRYTGMAHQLHVRSYRDYEEQNAKRAHIVDIPAGQAVFIPGDPGQVAAVWNTFLWNDGTLWNQGGANPADPTATSKAGATIRRGSSYGLCKALQLRLEGITPKAKWGVDAVILKVVHRRFR